jgi:hypothetical protein
MRDIEFEVVFCKSKELSVIFTSIALEGILLP